MLRFLFTLTVGVALGFFLAKLREGQIDQARLREARDEAIRFRAQMAAARQNEAVAATPPPASASPAQDDDLTRINGIGPVFQNRLRAAGIRTFTYLAASDPAALRAAVAAADWQKIEPERWIAEAVQLAAGQ